MLVVSWSLEYRCTLFLLQNQSIKIQKVTAMEESVGIIKLIQDQIINELNEAKTYLNAQAEFSDGSSSAFSKFVENYAYKVKPFLEESAKCIVALTKLNAKLTNEKTNNINKTNLVFSAYDSINTYCDNLKSQYTVLWKATSLALGLLVESVDNVNNYYNQYKAIYQKNCDLAKENVTLKTEYARYLKTQEYIRTDFKSTFQNQQMIQNASDTFLYIKDHLIKERSEFISEKQKIIDELNQKLEENNQIYQAEKENLLNEIEELKKANSELADQKDQCESEKESLEAKLKDKDEELHHFAAVVTKNEELESAISDLCERVPEISFEGGHFEVTANSIQADSIIKMTLERVRKDKLRLETDLESLRHSSAKEYKNLEQRLTDENRALKKALNESYTKLRTYGVEKSEMSTKISELNAELENERARAKDSEESLKRFRREATEAKARKEVITAGLDQRIKALSALKSSSRSNQCTIPTTIATADEALKESNEALRKELEQVKKKLIRTEQALKELSSSSQFTTQNQSESASSDSVEEREAALRRALEAEAREKRLKRRLEEERETAAREKQELELTISALRQTKEVEEPHPPPQPTGEPDIEIVEAQDSYEQPPTEDPDAAVE